MPTHHDCDFCARRGILALHSVGVEDDAEGTLGVLLVSDGAGNEVAETLFREEVRVGVEEINYHDGDGGGLAEGGEGVVGDQGGEEAAGEGGYYFGVRFWS